MLKNFTLTIWRFLDPLYYSCTRLRYVARRQNIFRVRVMTYRGQPITLSDGTTIVRGDRLLKIHLHNVRLLQLIYPLQSHTAKARKLRSVVMDSMPGLARLVQCERAFQDVKGVIGITQLNRACQSLGFDIVPIHNRGYRILKRMALLPIYLLSVDRPIQSFRKHQPMMLMMSKQMLHMRYAERMTM